MALITEVWSAASLDDYLLEQRPVAAASAAAPVVDLRWPTLRTRAADASLAASHAVDAAASAAANANANVVARAAAATPRREYIAPDMRGLMMDVLSNIPVKKVLVVDADEESAAQCSVCHELMQIGEHARQLPCRHAFHQHCIDVWVLQHATCPNCRRSVIPDDNDDDDDDNTPAAPATDPHHHHDKRTLRF